MGCAGRTRVTICATTAVSLPGLALAGLGILQNNLPYATAGSGLIISALVISALVLIRTWLNDTTDVRNSLAASQREAERERSRYITLRAHLENEQARLNRDAATAQQQMACDLLAERQALADEFEEKRNALVSDTMAITLQWVHEGKFDPEASAANGQIIHFPRPGQAVGHQCERSREHGFVGP